MHPWVLQAHGLMHHRYTYGKSGAEQHKSGIEACLPNATIAAAGVCGGVVCHGIVEGQADEHGYTVLLVDQCLDVPGRGSYCIIVGGIHLWEGRHLVVLPAQDIACCSHCPRAREEL